MLFAISRIRDKLSPPSKKGLETFAFNSHLVTETDSSVQIKNPPAMWETWLWSLGWEDPLEKGKATHSSILAWRVPWTVAKGWTWLSNFHFSSHNLAYISLVLFDPRKKSGKPQSPQQ